MRRKLRKRGREGNAKKWKRKEGEVRGKSSKRGREINAKRW